VGCSFKAEMKGNEVVRMVPYKDGAANEGHACVKGRFAWGYATHKDRILKPMIRAKITDPWREVSWEEAIGYAASQFRRIQAEHGKDSIGGIVSSRCTNEEGYLVQKLVRAAFGNNNVDTCARVCHSPTGYGLKTFGESAGTQTFRSVAKADVIMVIGANPTDGHPVFASRMKRACARGPADRGRPAPHRPGGIAAYPRRLSPAAAPGTNVAVVTSMAHVIVTEGLLAERSSPSAARTARSSNGAISSRCPRTRPRHSKRRPACRPNSCAAPPASTPPAATPRSTTAWA
jgi:formate dehydrogenase major subunit